MTFGERIKKIRELFGITSNEFAELVGIHPVTIRKYETNKMNPSKEHIDKMCEALKLPRMIFEGLPEQYTDFNYPGDFYQIFFSLLANKTLSIEKNKNRDGEYFAINPDLSKYITITYNGQELPLSELGIGFKYEDNPASTFDPMYFNIWYSIMKRINEIKQKKTWNVKEEGCTKEEAISELTKNAELSQLELMLTGHDWRQYMVGMESQEEAQEALQKVLDDGGTFWDYIKSIDAPEKKKNQLIEAYVDLKIEEVIEFPPYPRNGTFDEQMEWGKQKRDMIEKYKKENPNAFRK